MEPEVTEFLSEYGLFLAKTLTLVVAIAFLLVLATASAMKGRRQQDKGKLEVTHLNEELDELRDIIQHSVADKDALKAEKKARKADKKAEQKKLASGEADARKRVYVLDFDGDMKASQLDSLSRCVTAVLTMARSQDEVILRLESPGGMVHAYGLAAAQLTRLRHKNIPLTICVDKVAASGGYMMACVGDRILASPFAYIGSIGVILQLPNFNRLLKDHKVDYEMVTAGEYKRTLTMFGENTDKGREKVVEEIQEAHDLFKQFIAEYRPSLDLEAVATGETWFGTSARDRGLVDAISTSEDCILEACSNADVYAVSYTVKEPISKRLESLVEGVLDRSLLNWMRRNTGRRFYS